MKLEVYRKKDFLNAKSFMLAVGNLYDYLSGLKNNFFDFDYQRGIVSNPYLDSLLKSVLEGLPFPAITLTSNQRGFYVGENKLDLKECEILDGLQRTFRLWAIFYINQTVANHLDKNYREIFDILSNDDRGASIIKNNVVNRSSLKKLMDVGENGSTELTKIVEAFKNYEISINLWSGLNEKDIVNQMLVLNAGHKRVSKYLQLEILYLRLFNSGVINLPEGVEILREKSPEFKNLKKADSRKVGQYALTSVIIAFESYYNQEPKRVKGVNEFRGGLEDNEIAQKFADLLIGSTLNNFIKRIYEMDKKLSVDQELSYWYSKETTLSGIFAAIGNLIDPDNEADDFTKLDEFIKTIRPEDMNLSGYYEAYRRMSSVNVNVGTKVRNAIYKAFGEYEPGTSIDWIKIFKDNATRRNL